MTPRRIVPGPALLPAALLLAALLNPAALQAQSAAHRRAPPPGAGRRHPASPGRRRLRPWRSPHGAAHLPPVGRRGDPIAQFNLGVMLDFGRGTAADAAPGRGLVPAPALQGHAPAQFNLGGMYLDGSGVRPGPGARGDVVHAGRHLGRAGRGQNRAAVRQMISAEQAAEATRRASACQQSGWRDCD